MNHHTSKKLHSVYFQNLDACRFIAAFLVFLLHASNEIKALYPKIIDTLSFKIIYLFTSKGGLGVNFFFVLSGFLITYLILNEYKRKGNFHLGKFLIRRTLRIWPLYFIIGGIGFILFPLLFSDYTTAHQSINYFFFLANFDEIWYGAQDSINFLTSPWSVAVEEQFYLGWGILLFGLFRLKKFRFIALIITLYILSIIFSSFNWEIEKIMYHHTFIVCQDILAGAFIGWSLFNKKQWVDKLQLLSKWKVGAIYLAGFFICIAKNKLFAAEAILVERPLLSLFFGFIILDQIRGKYSLFKLGRISIFSKLGKISYGFYMYHLVIMYLLLKFIPFGNWPIVISSLFFFILNFSLTLIVSFLSYRFIESKFLSLKPQ